MIFWIFSLELSVQPQDSGILRVCGSSILSKEMASYFSSSRGPLNFESVILKLFLMSSSPKMPLVANEVTGG